jgi:hypothetical protein
MEEKETILNRVDQSGIITINLEEFLPEGERVFFDLKIHLFENLILREKDFRKFISDHDWSQYTGKFMAIGCSVDAIIPQWAYMLVASRASVFAREVITGDLDELNDFLFRKSLSRIDPEQYRDKKVVIKGCGPKPIPSSAYVEITRLLSPVVFSLMYGEPCSTVPVYKRK